MEFEADLSFEIMPINHPPAQPDSGKTQKSDDTVAQSGDEADA